MPGARDLERWRRALPAWSRYLHGASASVSQAAQDQQSTQCTRNAHRRQVVGEGRSPLEVLWHQYVRRCAAKKAVLVPVVCLPVTCFAFLPLFASQPVSAIPRASSRNNVSVVLRFARLASSLPSEQAGKSFCPHGADGVVAQNQPRQLGAPVTVV